MTKTKKNSKKKSFKKTKYFKILTNEGHSLTPRQQALFEREQSAFATSFSPLKMTGKTSAGKQKAESSSRKVFVQELKTSQYSLWREMSPGTEKESPYTLRFSKPVDKKKLAAISQKLDFGADVDSEEFEFDVTAKDLQKRTRPSQQKTVMGGLSAKDYMQAFGVNMIAQTQKEVCFHWAHRRAWFLKGSQTKDNLDAMTAAGNYHTLHKVETPIKNLLQLKQTEKIHVKGIVFFQDIKKRIPKSITYHFFWNSKSHCTVEIEPFSARHPSSEEIQAAKLVIAQEACGPAI
jgi:hypothetical protein